MSTDDSKLSEATPDDVVDVCNSPACNRVVGRDHGHARDAAHLIAPNDALHRPTGSFVWYDMRCPECGQMMTDHVIVTRHAAGVADGCNESFTGPSLPWQLEGCLIETERSGALDAFQRIAKLVEHDSEVYRIAAEQASVLAHEQRRVVSPRPKEATPSCGHAWTGIMGITRYCRRTEGHDGDHACVLDGDPSPY